MMTTRTKVITQSLLGCYALTEKGRFFETFYPVYPVYVACV